MHFEVHWAILNCRALRQDRPAGMALPDQHLLPNHTRQSPCRFHCKHLLIHRSRLRKKYSFIIHERDF